MACWLSEEETSLRCGADETIFQILQPALHHSLPSQPIRFRFERLILDHRDAAAERIRNAPGPLLHHVNQFMSKQHLPLLRVRIILARSEMNIRTPGESYRADRSGFRTDMHPDVAEWSAEGRFQLGLNLPWQRQPARLSDQIYRKCVYAGTQLHRRLALD
jgi:hypothetical protein